MLAVTLLKTTRQSFLVLTPACVLLGLATAILAGAAINWVDFSLVLVGALTAHISVNTLNEYYDFNSGLDFITTKTSFSGGSGALIDNPGAANAVLVVGCLAILVTMAIGFYLVQTAAAPLVPLGITGLFLVVTYTVWLNRLPLLCLIAPGLGFGPLMVVGTYIVLVGENNIMPWLISLVPFFLVNNLLLLSQYPDIKADTQIGRKTFPIAFGITNSNYCYGLFALAAYSTVLALIDYQLLSVVCLLALIPAAASLFAFMGARKHGNEIGLYPQYLAANVVAAIVTPLLLAVVIVVTQ
jgi:1,4-dihydroxy-2-naphthoate octaprenyltransferase